MSRFSLIGREARLILIMSYLLGAGVFLRALGYIARSQSQGVLITLLLGAFLVLLTIEQLELFRAPWQHHLYFTIQTILLATLLLLPPGYDFYAVLFFPLSTQALLHLTPRAGRIWIGAFTLVWTTIFVLASGLSGLVLSVFFAVGAIFFASFGLLTMQTLAANRQLAAYAVQVEDLTIANERQRMARELHDTLAQGLAGLILQLEAADSYLARGQVDRTAAIIQQAMTRARTTLAASRQAIQDLRATDTSARDLAELVRAEAEQFSETTGIPVMLDVEPLPILDIMVRETVLRTVAEALTNIARHAHAKQVWVRVAVENNVLVVTIRDDGVGFDTARIHAQAGHYGLIGLHERARIAGGDLGIMSKKENGTTVVMRLPMEGLGMSALRGAASNL